MSVKNVYPFCDSKVYLKLIGLILCIGCSFYYWQFVHNLDLTTVRDTTERANELHDTDIEPAVASAQLGNVDDLTTVRNTTERANELHDTDIEPAVASAQLGNVNGDDTCRSLLADGRFVDPFNWKPYGCKLYKYTRVDARTCFRKRARLLNKNNVLLFMGDSKVRSQYFSLLKLLTGENHARKSHGNVTYFDSDIRLKMAFYFNGMIDKQRYSHYENVLARNARGNGAPDLIFNGGALWLILGLDGSNASIANYRERLEKVVPFINNLTRSSRVMWMLQENLEEHKLIPEKKNMFNNYLMRRFNEQVQLVLKPTRVDIWSSLVQVRQGLPDPTFDGIHLKSHVLQRDTQILVNWFCNEVMSFGSDFCCNNKRPLVDSPITPENRKPFKDTKIIFEDVDETS